MPDTLPPETHIEGARAYKGLAFDADGLLVGSDNSSLIKSSYDGDWSVFLPGAGDIEQMTYLPDGDLVVTTSWSNGHMRRITPEGGVSVLAPGLSAYSVILGPDGMLYGAGWDGVYRVDPETGESDELLSTRGGGPSGRTLAFSADLTRLYMGTVDDRGRIFYFELGEDLEILSEPKLFVEGVGHGWHDGLGVDICGNLWAADYDSSKLFRISPDGQIDVMADWSDNSNQFGHGLFWGSGVGGWRADALYMPVPEAGKKVKELVIGVPAAVLPTL